MKLCHACRQPLAPHDAHDAHVLRPVHRACYLLRLAAPRYRPTPDTPLGKRTRELLPRRVR